MWNNMLGAAFSNTIITDTIISSSSMTVIIITVGRRSGLEPAAWPLGVGAPAAAAGGRGGLTK